MDLRREKTIPLTIQLAPAAYKRLLAAAKTHGYRPSGFAQLLFNAAYAARIGMERGEPADDAELDEQVRLVFALAGQADADAIARAIGIPADRVNRILDGFLHVMAGEEKRQKPRLKGTKS